MQLNVIYKSLNVNIKIKHVNVISERKQILWNFNADRVCC